LDRNVDTISEVSESQTRLVVSWKTFPEFAMSIRASPEERCTFLSMQQEPQLKTRVGHRKKKTDFLCLSDGLRQIELIYINDAPHLVEPARSVARKLSGVVYDPLRRT
jgi:hypothetical protein